MYVYYFSIFFRDIDENCFSETENAKEMSNNIDHVDQVDPVDPVDYDDHEDHVPKHMWFAHKQNKMIGRIRELKELLLAIKQQDRDKIMRIYYRTQHIHTLDDRTSPLNVQICVERDRLNSDWLPHIQNALEKISIATPGIKFTYTQNSFERSTNYIRIGFDKIDIDKEKEKETYEKEYEKLLTKAYTSYNDEYPFIHLGHNRPLATMQATSLHELLHALGFCHQMQRRDSDLYVNVDMEKLKGDKNLAYQYERKNKAFTRFDPFSIMMYPEDEIMTRLSDEKIWELKSGPERSKELSELDKVALNLVYKPCKSESKHMYLPVISETTNMLYCGRDVMQFHNQNVPPTISSKCGPQIWANCPSCRVFKDVQSYCGKKTNIITIKKCLEEGKWQGLSGNFYCGNKYAEEFLTFRFDTCIESDGVCGPDQGIPCTDCGKLLKPGYSYKDFNPIPTI